MTDKEIIEKLATEFMGWQLGNSVRGGEVWLTKRGERPISIPLDDFDPLHDPTACALVKAELRRCKCSWFVRYLSPPQIYQCEIQSDTLVGLQEADTEERAVCLAVLASIGD